MLLLRRLIHALEVSLSALAFAFAQMESQIHHLECAMASSDGAVTSALVRRRVNLLELDSSWSCRYGVLLRRKGVIGYATRVVGRSRVVNAI